MACGLHGQEKLLLLLPWSMVGIGGSVVVWATLQVHMDQAGSSAPLLP